ncbi:MAG TPA: hypothetical protein VF742_09715 [Terracidiphilus sp.]|jgi:hypothetical protein
MLFPVPVLSVDLVYSRWSDLGIAILSRPEGEVDPIACELIAWDASDLEEEHQGKPVHAEILAGRLNHLANVRGIQVLLLDGPQAWKSQHNGLVHARLSERQLNCAAKTGLPGIVKPATYRTFAEFCVDVYDALCRRGWKRLATQTQPGAVPERVLVESYPHAAWRSLGIQPLPSKRRARVSDLAASFVALQTLIPLTVNRPPNHDQLQAIVGGLPGLAIEAQEPGEARFVGEPPRREEGHWREGFIVLPVLPHGASNLHWLR